ncbi:hypothetical protein GLOIN_2v1474294 [Rhizophagus irregularis DAOM 181602=DAOM 197198]|uniref:Uncharacterized protein n=1 Tax=Rhizophagus irregularis (strain DAOM 181602 / DAOM 197198 / MUCL 43194) TaxID=747089 RepID=A0A2P4QGP4_RHIID|nr:hypothetical protein GLOIN_2v1474294 [Rhizophagus irregularis DAOM 181602=DAOM 197198]POG76811.1 hypothetical protein GLOIN_2v1474294 [Rhizophagus irregularis DAOM 181602=DAOM 197198]|eukprot:XP_025183677.1 hypothetical protein GLOIN_2v1474294 [Rhizophagus irregularis DAOM 181602=DAOM 197198]
MMPPEGSSPILLRSGYIRSRRIVLLDMVKAYFSYTGCTFCGIPKITLEGTLEDWTKLQEKVVQLPQLDLDIDFWLDRLDPVVWKLVETYKGEIDEKNSNELDVSPVIGWFVIDDKTAADEGKTKDKA